MNEQEKRRAVDRFVHADLWELKHFLEVTLGEMGFEIMVPEVYDLGAAFMVTVARQQSLAKKWLDDKQLAH